MVVTAFFIFQKGWAYGKIVKEIGYCIFSAQEIGLFNQQEERCADFGHGDFVVMISCYYLHILHFSDPPKQDYFRR